MSAGPATKMHDLLRNLEGGLTTPSAIRRAARDAGIDITPATLEAMDAAASVWALDRNTPMLAHQAMLISALELEIQRRKEAGNGHA